MDERTDARTRSRKGHSNAASVRRQQLAAESVPRTALLAKLERSHAPIIAMMTPTGHGKTTLIRQWQEQDRRQFAWVNLEQKHNDPAQLVMAVVGAVGMVWSVESAVLRAAGRATPDAASVAEMVASMTPPPAGGVLVIEDAHVITSPGAREIFAAIAQSMPAGVQVVITSRGRPPLPIARLRAKGLLFELTAADLAMDEQEAHALFVAAGLSLPRATIAAVNPIMDGWPAALYLAALAIESGDAEIGPTTWPRGTDRFIGDYVRNEVLGSLSKEDMDFLISTSLPAAVSGPLCDALLGTHGSAEHLARLEELTGLLIPQDREGQWYRYHHVVRDFLQAELRRRSPGSVTLLSRRAASWYEANGLPAQAISAAAELGDDDTVLRLVGAWAHPFFQEGRIRNVERWVKWIETQGLMTRDAHIALTGALVQIVTGRAATAERWIEAAETAAADLSGDELVQVRGALGVLRAFTCPRDVEQMKIDAEEAVALLSPGNPWRAGGLVMKGIALWMLGQRDEGDFALQEGVEAAEDTDAPVWASIALAERALIARDSGHSQVSDVLAERACTVITDGNLHEYTTSALAQVACAASRLAHGDIEQARRNLVRAERLRPQLTHAQPVYAVQVWLEAARNYLSVTDGASARTMLREANDILWKRPHLDQLTADAEELRQRANHLRGAMAGATALTSAELRLLPMLATYLSFRQIGERLFISVNTVKTEAISIYRKLGASSRSEALDRAYELGLIRPPLDDDLDGFHPLGVR